MRGWSPEARGGAWRALGVVGLGLCLGSAAFWARPAPADPASDPQAGAAGGAAGAPGAPPVRDAGPPVPLDALLKLPPGTPATPEQRVGGATRAEWTERFRAARENLASAEKALAEAQAKLETLATGADSWQVTAPGAPAGSESGPLSFGLRQEIRRQRDEVDRAQRRLEDLRVEANLAGVPETWVAAEPAAAGAAPAAGATPAP